MEVLVRWRCLPCCQSKKAHCYNCNGKTYTERWVPYSLLHDVRALVKNALVIEGCRNVPDHHMAYLD